MTLDAIRRRYDAPDILEAALVVTAILSWAVIIFYAATQMMARIQFGVQFLGVMTVVYILHQSIDVAQRRDVLDAALLSIIGLIAIVTTVYVNVYFDTLLNTRLGYALEHEYLLGGLFVLSILYLTYRAYGMTFFLVVVGSLVYAFYGEYFPGLLRHGGTSVRGIINILVWEFDGLYGNINQIVAAWVALFLLYAGLMRGYGAFDLILRAAFRAGNVVKSGVAQAAVTASIIIGSITGSQTANTAITGSFTIPLMKEHGLKPETAGGIESVASSGGQIMPPVMGAAAFVMASLLGISYLQVLVAGLIPAAIFYISVIVGVHYNAVKQLDDQHNLDIGEYTENKSQSEIAVQSVRFIIPFLVLVYTLGIVQWTVMSAALYTCLTMFATGIGFPLLREAYETKPYELSFWTPVREAVGSQDSSRVRRADGVSAKAAAAWTVLSQTRRDLEAIPRFSSFAGQVLLVFKQTLDGLRYGAVTLAPIAIVIAAINGIVDLLMASGVPGKFSLALLGISGGVMVFAVLLSMAVCIILGLGMPTVAAYVIVAIFVAPPLITEFGIPEMAAHYFVFYAAILSGLTPPIAIAVVVATGIAGSNFWATCYHALKISAALFVLPIVFVYNPEIVVGGMNAYTLFSGIVALVGAVSLTHGLNFYRWRMRSRVGNLGLRTGYVAFGVAAMVVPDMTVRLAAVVASVAMFVAQRRLVPEITELSEDELAVED